MFMHCFLMETFPWEVSARPFLAIRVGSTQSNICLKINAYTPHNVSLSTANGSKIRTRRLPKLVPRFRKKVNLRNSRVVVKQ